jgi:hypothetical protein
LPGISFTIFSSSLKQFFWLHVLLEFGCRNQPHRGSHYREKDNGDRVLSLSQGGEGSFGATGDMISVPLRIEYDDHGDLVLPG